MNHLEKIAYYFNTRAAYYDNPVTTFIGERELRVIRTLVPSGSQVLDYGCGTGRTTLDHLCRGCQVTAYDLSGKMLARAEAKAQQLGLLAEFTTDPARLANRTWPIVTCIGVLDYYPDPAPLLRTLCEYLSPKGRLIVTYPNALSPLGWLYRLGSRFTIPALTRTPQFARQTAAQAGLQVLSLRFAFPSVRPFGHTLILALTEK
jgi:2-polyprenyl-3-methyl-5-hydroxy-6-metoxy-1,4-benzoquinol methylase